MVGGVALAIALVIISPALAGAKQLGTRTLRLGMKGGDVRALQVDLTKLGLRTATVGTFGPQTQANVERFQRKYRLKVTGAVNASMVAALGTALAAGERDATVGSGGSGFGAAKGSPAKTKVTNSKASSADPTSDTDPVLAPVKQDGGSQHLGERTLKPGMKGHDVRVLQGYLTVAGYPTTVDGEFGSGTETQVVAFEQADSLPDDGAVTPSDALALRHAVASAEAGGAPSQATLNPDGTVTAPANAPKLVQEAIAAANQIITKPYIWGGGHRSFFDKGYDCSGAVSFALHGANLLDAPEDSTDLESYGSAGPGKWITIYADSAHAFVVIAGLAFDTSHYGPVTPGGTGPRWLTAANATANLSDGGNYVVRHPSAL